MIVKNFTKFMYVYRNLKLCYLLWPFCLNFLLYNDIFYIELVYIFKLYIYERSLLYFSNMCFWRTSALYFSGIGFGLTYRYKYVLCCFIFWLLFLCKNNLVKYRQVNNLKDYFAMCLVLFSCIFCYNDSKYI